MNQNEKEYSMVFWTRNIFVKQTSPISWLIPLYVYLWRQPFLQLLIEPLLVRSTCGVDSITSKIVKVQVKVTQKFHIRSA